MDLSIIIVNWNSKDYLRACLESLLAQHPQTGDPSRMSYEVIVIDSGSLDGCGEMLAADFPEVRFIQSQDNLGFAKANNQAVDAATGDYLLFLNPDTEFESPAIQTLFETMQSLPDAGILGARLLNSDRSLQTSAVQAFPNLANQLFALDALRRRFPKAAIWGTSALYAENGQPSEVDVVSGACMLMKRELFEQVDRFTTAYFMYSEDVDLCYKVRAAGLKTYYVPQAEIIHHGGSSSERSEVSTFASVMILESRWKYFRATRSPGYSWLYRLLMGLMSLFRVSIALVLYGWDKLRSREARYQFALKKWLARLRWTLGLETWVKKYRT